MRISIGRFSKEKTNTIKIRLLESYQELAPGILAMKGNISFVAGMDLEHDAMVNVSVWDSLESAKQMETFKPMLDLGKEFSALGVTFERPILNFTRLWEIRED
jgi:hypothetical protein